MIKRIFNLDNAEFQVPILMLTMFNNIIPIELLYKLRKMLFKLLAGIKSTTNIHVLCCFLLLHRWYFPQWQVLASWKNQAIHTFDFEEILLSFWLFTKELCLFSRVGQYRTETQIDNYQLEKTVNTHYKFNPSHVQECFLKFQQVLDNLTVT